jgi:tellurite resistance protein TerC
MGLRSLYFLLAGVIGKFHFLKLGLSAVLVFVGLKMLVTYFHVEIPIGLSLGIVGGILALSIVGSLAFPKQAVETLSSADVAPTEKVTVPDEPPSPS